MSHPGPRSEQFAGNGSGGKRFFGKKSSKNCVNSRNTGFRNHADPAVVVNENSRQQQYSTTQTNSSEGAHTPIWFSNYMQMFLQQITDDVTSKIMDYLASSVEDEATRARHKHSYFALKRRYNLLENELAQERAKNNSQGNYSQNIPSQNDRPLSSENRTIGNQNGLHRYESQRRNSKKMSPEAEKRKGPLVSPISPPSSVNKPGLKPQHPEQNKQTVFPVINPKINDKVAKDLKNDVSKTRKINTNYKKIIKETNLDKVKSNSDNQTLMEDTKVTVKCSQIEMKDEKFVDKKVINDIRKNPKLLNQDVFEEIEFIKENTVESAGKNKDCDKKKVKDIIKTDNGDKKNIDDAEKIKDKENPSVVNKITTLDNNDENDKHSEQKANDTDLIGFVAKMQDLLMALTLENIQTLQEEITNFKNLTKWEINKIVELFFEKTKDNPELSDSLALLLSKIADVNSGYFKLPDMIISVCENDFAEKIAEKIIFIGSLFEGSLLPEYFMKKCIQHFIYNRTENNVEHLCDLLEIVGETPEFWKSFDGLDDLEKIVDDEKSVERVRSTINRIFLGIKAADE